MFGRKKVLLAFNLYSVLGCEKPSLFETPNPWLTRLLFLRGGVQNSFKEQFLDRPKSPSTNLAASPGSGHPGRARGLAAPPPSHAPTSAGRSGRRRLPWRPVAGRGLRRRSGLGPLAGSRRPAPGSPRSRGPTDIVQEILPWPDPRGGIIVAGKSVTVEAHRPAGCLEGHQQILDMGDVVALRHEPRQRRKTRARRTGRIAQAADRPDDVVAERLGGDREECRGRVREQICDSRTAVELEVGVPPEIESGNVLAPRSLQPATGSSSPGSGSAAPPAAG